MTRNLLSLDFYGNELIAALAGLDEKTGVLQLRRVVRRTSRFLTGGRVSAREEAQQDVHDLLTAIAPEGLKKTPVVAGLRGSWLSFKRSSGFASASRRNHPISAVDVENALRNSVPTTLSDDTEVIDILPQAYTIDGNTGITNPVGLPGFTLEVETFLSLVPSVQLTLLTHLIEACGCEDFQLYASSVAQGHQLLSAAEKQAGTLLLDIGETSSSAAMYHKGTLVEAWEIPAGEECLARAVADLLQNDVATAKEVLKTYEPGTDEMIDDALTQAHTKLISTLQRTLQQTVLYVKHPPVQLVLSGQAAGKALLKICKQILGVRKARLAAATALIKKSSDAAAPIYAGALSLLSYLVARENNDVDTSASAGLLDTLFDKLGLG